MERTQMKLRSSISKEEKEAMEDEKKKSIKPKIYQLLKFKGKIVYCTTFIECATICDELVTKANKMEDLMVIGFDMEWPFSWKTGPGKTALIQISPNLKISYLFHISQMRNLPKALSELLSHSNVRITGVNIKNDVRKLCRDFRGFDGDKIVENCIDTGVLANKLLDFSRRWSMLDLLKELLNVEIDKNKKVRMSQWHVHPLTKDQKIYAATDSYASLLLYHKLEQDLPKL